MNEKRVLARILAVWTVYRVIVTVVGYVSGYVVGFVVGTVTGDVELATAAGTGIGTVLMLGADLVLFVLALHWLSKPEQKAPTAELPMETPAQADC